MYKDQYEVTALLEAADIDAHLKAFYQDVLTLDNILLNKLGAGMLADGLRNEGARFLLSEDGSFKKITAFDLSPYTFIKIIDAVVDKRILAKVVSGKDFFKKLSTKPETVEDLERVCEIAPLPIKKDYICAAYSALSSEGRPRTVLQYAVNYSVGVGETGISKEEEQRESYNLFSLYAGRRVDHIKRNVSYVAKPLGLEPRKQDSNTRQHPAIYALEKFIRGLPYGEAFHLAASSEKPTTLDEKLARPLTAKEDETAAFIKKMLFGNKQAPV